MRRPEPPDTQQATKMYSRYIDADASNNGRRQRDEVDYRRQDSEPDSSRKEFGTQTRPIRGSSVIL